MTVIPGFPTQGATFGPNPNSSLGSFFEDGLRIGTDFGGGRQQFPANSIYDFEGKPLQPNYDLWGPGVPLSPIVTYNVRPFCAAIDRADVTVDIGTFPPGTTANTFLTFTPDVTDPSEALGTTWNINNQGAIPQVLNNITPTSANNPNGNQSLRIDWPRALGITVTGAQLADTTSSIYVQGRDFYGNVINAFYGNGSGTILTAITPANRCYQYSPFPSSLVVGPPAVPAAVPFATSGFTNRAFYTIDYAIYFGTTIPAGCSVSIVTTRQLGLPWVFDYQTCNLLGVTFNGITELGCGGVNGSSYQNNVPITLLNGNVATYAALGLDAAPLGTALYQQAFFGAPAPASGSGFNRDPRGTYSPSVAVQTEEDDAINPRLMITWYQGGIDPLNNIYNAAGMPAAPFVDSDSTIVEKNRVADVFGYPIQLL